MATTFETNKDVALMESSTKRLSPTKFGIVVPNRVFVGGISHDTTEMDLCRLFSTYGQVKSARVIVDRAGYSKGYGFVTFESELDARKLQEVSECVVLRDRKLNIAPAIKKRHTTPLLPTPVAMPSMHHFNLPSNSMLSYEQTASNATTSAGAYYPQASSTNAAPSMSAVYNSNSMQYQSMYQYYPMPAWPQYY